MLTSATTLVERRTVITSAYGTHPYEAGWASEALFFVRTEGPHPELTVQPQVSPDGVDWLDQGGVVTLPADRTLIQIGMVRFGTWIRLLLTGASPDAPATLLVHLALKG
jgi:Domain of unknown function (DUF6385)